MPLPPHNALGSGAPWGPETGRQEAEPLGPFSLRAAHSCLFLVHRQQAEAGISRGSLCGAPRQACSPFLLTRVHTRSCEDQRWGLRVTVLGAQRKSGLAPLCGPSCQLKHSPGFDPDGLGT